MKQLAYSIMLVITSILLAKPSLADSQEKGVLYWQEKNDSVEMRVYLPDQKTSLVMATLNDRPYRLFFSGDGNEVFYILGMHLYRMEWMAGAKPVTQLTMPNDWSKIENELIWRDKTTNKWRFAYSDPSLDEYPVVTKGDEHYLNYKGKLVVINNGYYRSNKDRTDIKIGIKYALEILNVREYDPKTGWRTIANVSTTCNAHSDPCYDALGSHRQPVTLMSEQALRINMYKEDTKLVPHESIGNGEEYTNIYKTNPDTNTLIKVCISDFGHSGGQFYPPLSLIRKDTNKEIILMSDKKEHRDRYDYLGIEQHKHYLLVTQSVYANSGQLFDMNTGTQVFLPPEASPLSWVQLPRK